MQTKSINTDKKVFRQPKRFFEISGSVDTETAYYVILDGVTNAMKQDLKTMVDLGRYFSIFAPRQSGKTTFFEGIREQLHRDSTYAAIQLSFENYSQLGKSEFYQLMQDELYGQLLERLEAVNCDKRDAVKEFLDSHRLTDHISLGKLFQGLNQLIQFKKIVIFIDEFDGIPRHELGNFLNTLRSLFQRYKKVKQKALYSIGLIGIRNITKLVVGGVSPFNIADQVDLPSFSLKNITDLYNQYTQETNQPFSPEAIKKIHEETAGQPWLVNRLGTILTTEIKPGTVEPILESDVEKAVEELLLENNNHFDNLYEKAAMHKETFVKIVFNNTDYKPDDQDQSRLEQYGLIRKEGKKAVPANNIYKKRFLNTFFDETRVPETLSVTEYILPDNQLDMENILQDFGHYFTRIGVRGIYHDDKPYEKPGQFQLTAWLYQFVRNGEGELSYGAPSGLGIMDILLVYKGRKYIIETKVNHHNIERTINQGIKQLTQKYLATESRPHGYLVIFDPKTPVGQPCKLQHHQEDDKTVTSITIGIGKVD